MWRLLLLLILLGRSASAMAGKHEGIYSESKGKGPPLVLIHGGQMDRRMWDFQFEEFANEYRVIRCDIRGFGKSDVPLRPHSYTQDLRSLLKHLKVEKALLAGLSLGAAIATDFAIVYPETVNALVLVCPGLGGFKFEDKANDLRAITDAARDEDYDKAAELWLQNPYMSVAMENPQIQSRLRTLARENAHCWLNNPVLLRRMTPPAVERLREIRAPTLVVGGGRDVSDIHRITTKLRTEIATVEEHILPKCGHIVPMEAPAEFNAILARFLAKNHRER